MYSKPLASRMDGVREAPTKVKRGVPLNGAINFSSFLQQGGVASAGLPGQGMGKGMGHIPGQLGGQAGGAGGTPLEQAGAQNNLVHSCM